MLDVLDTYSHIPNFASMYESELGQIGAAAERAAERIGRETATLTRPDGSPKFAPEEHQEQLAAIHEAVGAEYDRAVSRYAAKAEQDAEAARTKLALLDGFDPFDTLTADQKQQAATRQPFVREDCETLPTSELVKQARAALAANDKPRIYLLGRYLGRRVSPVGPDGMPRVRTGSVDPELVAVVRDLDAVFGDDDRATKRRELEERLRATEGLPIAINAHRSAFDGSRERMMVQMRSRYGSF